MGQNMSPFGHYVELFITAKSGSSVYRISIKEWLDPFALKTIVAIEDPAVIAKILAHLDLPTRAPPRSPSQTFYLFATA